MIPKTACTPPTVKVKRKKGHIAVTYADNFFLPFARLAAKTFLPPGVLILALKCHLHGKAPPSLNLLI